MQTYKITGGPTVLDAIDHHERAMGIAVALVDKKDNALIRAIEFCEERKLHAIMDDISVLLVKDLTEYMHGKRKKIDAVMPHLEALGFLGSGPPGLWP